MPPPWPSRAGMIPSRNSMMAVGLASLPGRVTGQILGGTLLTPVIRRRRFGPGDRPLLR